MRRFRREDAGAVTALAAETPGAANWSRESYAKFAEEDSSLALVSQVDGEIVGFLIGRRVQDQAEVLNLAISSRQRRSGNGSSLLRAALDEFERHGVKSVYLEVRESNTGAIAFYERHGFTKTGRRKGYYRLPNENGVTMVRKLTG